MSRQSVHAYLRAHPELRKRVAIAHRQTKIIDHHAPRMLPEVVGPPPCDSDDLPSPGTITPAGRAEFIRLLGEHARDGSSKGCAKALDILAQLHFAPEILAMQAKAKREALEQAGEKSTRRPVVIRVPTRKPNSDVIETELVDPRETRH